MKKYNLISTLNEAAKNDTSTSSKLSTFFKEVGDEIFDNIMKDGVISADENDKIEALSKKFPEISPDEIKKLIRKTYQHNKENPRKKVDFLEKELQAIVDKRNVSAKQKHDDELNKKQRYRQQYVKKLSSIEIKKLKDLIFKSRGKNRTDILKFLEEMLREKKGEVKSDKPVDNKTKTPDEDNDKNVNETLDMTTISNRVLTNNNIIYILSSIYEIYRKHPERVIKQQNRPFSDSNNQLNGNKLPNNIVTRTWKQHGSRRERDHIIKLMRTFLLDDNQIYKIFNKIQKPLTNKEMDKYEINTKYSTKGLTRSDLYALKHSLSVAELEALVKEIKRRQDK